MSTTFSSAKTSLGYIDSASFINGIGTMTRGAYSIGSAAAKVSKTALNYGIHSVSFLYSTFTNTKNPHIAIKAYYVFGNLYAAASYAPTAAQASQYLFPTASAIAQNIFYFLGFLYIAYKIGSYLYQTAQSDDSCS